eukprot:COSAG01_NODE_37279_length_505_cov_3.901478_1_plen_100_part_00
MTDNLMDGNVRWKSYGRRRQVGKMQLQLYRQRLQRCKTAYLCRQACWQPLLVHVRASGFMLRFWRLLSSAVRRTAVGTSILLHVGWLSAPCKIGPKAID